MLEECDDYPEVQADNSGCLAQSEWEHRIDVIR